MVMSKKTLGLAILKRSWFGIEYERSDGGQDTREWSVYMRSDVIRKIQLRELPSRASASDEWTVHLGGNCMHVMVMLLAAGNFPGKQYMCSAHVYTDSIVDNLTTWLQQQ